MHHLLGHLRLHGRRVFYSSQSGAFNAARRLSATGNGGGRERREAILRVLQPSWPCRALTGIALDSPYPSMTLYIAHSWADFSMVDISTVGVVSVPKKLGDLAESFPKAYRSVLALLAPSWLSSNRAWKIAQGGCDILYTPSCTTVLAKHSQRRCNAPWVCCWYCLVCEWFGMVFHSSLVRFSSVLVLRCTYSFVSYDPSFPSIKTQYFCLFFMATGSRFPGNEVK